MAFSGFTQLVATRLPILRFAMVKTSSTYHQKSPSQATQPHSSGYSPAFFPRSLPPLIYLSGFPHPNSFGARRGVAHLRVAALGCPTFRVYIVRLERLIPFLLHRSNSQIRAPGRHGSSPNARTSTEYSGGERGQYTEVQPDGFHFVVCHQSDSMPGHEIWVQELALWSHAGSQCVDKVGLRPTPQRTSRCEVS